MLIFADTGMERIALVLAPVVSVALSAAGMEIVMMERLGVEVV